MGIDLSGVENLGIAKVIKRGTAEILERDDDGIFVFDTVSRAYMISSTDTDRAKQWLLRHSDRDYQLLAAVGDPMAAFITKEFAFRSMLKCHQLAYFGKEPHLPGTALAARPAVSDDLDFIAAHYDILSREELEKIILRGKMTLGILDGKPAGFAGEHLEGSLGILYILPEYRNRGFGGYLEKYQMKEMLKEGYIPFGQVEEGNDKSLRLQKKLGFKEGSELVYWFF